ncbi:MAG: hypothetical protein U0W24_11205 [Bacteroidales bacterium]
MKTLNLTKLISTFIFLLVFSFTYAIEPVVKPLEGKKVMVNLPNVPQNTYLSITDVDGVILFTEKLEQTSNGFSKVYNFENLSNGNYTIELNGDFKKVSFPVTIESKDYVSLTNAKSEFFKPIFRVNGSKVLITKNNPYLIPVTINVYNKYGELVYEETMESKKEIAKIINLSEAFGSFKIVVLANGEVFEHRTE